MQWGIGAVPGGDGAGHETPVGHPGHLVAACSVTGTAATTNEEAATVERLIFHSDK